jgi:hypothetical protein
MGQVQISLRRRSKEGENKERGSKIIKGNCG